MYMGVPVKAHYSCPILTKHEFFTTDFRKIFKYQISRKSIQWKSSCSKRTDRHDEANSHFSQFREIALKKQDNRRKDLQENTKGKWRYRISCQVLRVQKMNYFIYLFASFHGTLTSLCLAICYYTVTLLQMKAVTTWRYNNNIAQW